MQVHYGVENLPNFRNAVVTNGTFDGVHVGHRKILKRLQEISVERNGESVLITFHPHPRIVVGSAMQELKMLSTIDEKIEKLEAQGIEHLVIIPFTRQFSELTSLEFIEKVLVEKIQTKTLVIGHDHRFGKNREGGFDYLVQNQQKFGFIVEEIPRHDLENVTVSSTKIRQALHSGSIQVANHLLGHYYSLSGIVVKGKQLGRTIGYPTANIQVREDYKLTPANGVYAVQVRWQKQCLKGMLNIGTRPTVDGTFVTIEVNIFDFSAEIYGENLSVELVSRIRDEVKFSGLDTLKQQLAHDAETAKKHLALKLRL